MNPMLTMMLYRSAPADYASEEFNVSSDYAHTMETLSLLARPEPTKAPASETSKKRSIAPSSDALIKQYGNLIEGADPTGLRVSENEVVIRKLSILSEKVEKAADKTKEQEEDIKKLKKRQEEIESSALKSSDMKVLSERVIKNLQERLRMERSRFSGRK